jgi:hypothetical protein
LRFFVDVKDRSESAVPVYEMHRCVMHEAADAVWDYGHTEGVEQTVQRQPARSRDAP